MSRTTVLPLILDVKQGGRSAALMDEKSFSKSREQGHLWVNHPVTGRILPAAGEGQFLTLEKRMNHYYAQLTSGSSVDVYGEEFAEADIEAHTPLEESAGESKEGGADNGILESLGETIARRHEEMPEGSYTTHLFSKGVPKIKKKCGEEAIELVLAETPEDLVYESADLIYHMMVLLEAEGLGIADVLAELKKRDS